MSLETFLWVDGQRPTPNTLTGWADWLAGLGLERAVLILNDVKNEGETWRDENLLAATSALQDRGLKVVWMYWATSTKAAIDKQIEDLGALFDAGARPDGLQWDCEEHWRKTGVDLAPYLSDKILALLSRHDCAHTPVAGRHHVEISITAIMVWGPRVLREQDAAVCQSEAFTAGYTQAYLFYNSKPGHWSHGLPKEPGAIQRLTWEAWAKQLDGAVYSGLDKIYMGNACHFQRIPGIKGLDGMRYGVDESGALNDRHPRVFGGCGWWSAKHAKGDKGKQAIIRAAAGIGASDAPVTPPSAPINVTSAVKYNSGKTFYQGIPETALERYPGLRMPHTSNEFALSVASYQQDHGLTVDGKLGSGTLGHMVETFGHKQPDAYSFIDAAAKVRGSGGKMVRSDGPCLDSDDIKATDWRVI